MAGDLRLFLFVALLAAPGAAPFTALVKGATLLPYRFASISSKTSFAVRNASIAAGGPAQAQLLRRS
jgi:hypothetical protein